MFYENFLNSIEPNMDIIPESASFTDMSIFANRSIQDVYNETVISMASNEMAIFEAVVLEAEGEPDPNSDVQKALAAKESPENKKRILDYIKEFFAKIWSAIKGFFATIINKIKEFFNKQQMKKLEKLCKQFNSAVNYFKSNSSDAKLGEIKSLKETWAVFKLLNNFINDGETVSKNMLNKLAGIKKEDGANAAEELLSKEFSQDAIDDAIFGVKSNNNQKDTISIAFANIEKTEITAKNVGTYAGKITTLLKCVNGWIGEIKKAYNASKKNIDSFMAAAKKLTNINTKAVRAYCNGCKRIVSTLNKAIGASNSEFKKIYQGALSTAKATISAAKKAGATINESTEEYSGIYDAFNENFNFVLEEDEVEASDDEPSTDSEEIDFDVKEEKCK
jgi:hypothetical protein